MAKQVVVKSIDKRFLVIPIVGDSALIMHRWDEKVKKQMLDKQMKKSVTKQSKDPEEQYNGSKYQLKNGQPAFPADAFKQAAVRGAKALGMVMIDAMGSFFVHGIYSKRDQRELVPINGEFEMREDMVKLANGVADIRYRAQITDWNAELNVEYNASVISDEQLVNMFNAAGFGVGVGEWRPGKKGWFGRFHVRIDGE